MRGSGARSSAVIGDHQKSRSAGRPNKSSTPGSRRPAGSAGCKRPIGPPDRVKMTGQLQSDGRARKGAREPLTMLHGPVGKQAIAMGGPRVRYADE